MEHPTYGELIEFLNVAESASTQKPEETLSQIFSLKYPDIPINRQTRFLDTVRRVAAPTRPSAVGRQKLVDSPLKSYLRRRWIPRTRHNYSKLSR